jgi:hypothetical protein
MSDSRAFGEELLGRLVGLLPPAPEGWVRAAQEIPAFRRTLDEIVARAEEDRNFRAALLADLEAAIAQAGYRPEPRVLEAIRRRMSAERGAEA